MNTELPGPPGGGFAETLRAAIDASGLGLGRIQYRLRERGITVSAATLSYWQSGRSRPERPASVLAIGHLEDILALPKGALTGLLGDRRPRGRWPARTIERPPLDAFWPESADLADLAAGIDTRWDVRLARISQHDVVFVGPDREERACHTRQVLRAEDDGPDRWVAIVHIDEPDGALPDVQPLRHCRLGRVQRDHVGGFLAAELLFDRPLAKGETIVTEHALLNRPPHPQSTNYERKFRLPVREYVLEVCFDLAAVPARCERFAFEDGRPGECVPARIEAGEVHGVALDFGPGCYGFRWSW